MLHHDKNASRTVAATPAALSCRNNTSDYYVNGKRMNVKEVTSLLKAKGIDLDNNRFLILQVSMLSDGKHNMLGL
jgi:hypothetical protein